MTKQDFDALFLAKKIGVFCHNALQYEQMLDYIRSEYEIDSGEDSYDPNYPYIFRYANGVTGWTGGGSSYSHIGKVDFEEFRQALLDVSDNSVTIIDENEII